MQQNRLARVLIYTVLIIGALAAVTPFLYMLMTSLKSYGSVITNNFWPWFPLGNEPLQFNNYADAIQQVGWDKQWNVPLVVRYFANSLVTSLIIVLRQRPTWCESDKPSLPVSFHPRYSRLVR